MKHLVGKVAIVTGASSGIGRATARLFAQEGAKVVVAARRSDALQALVEEIDSFGGQAKAFSGDVTEESFAKALVEFTLNNFSKLDVAVNNAGRLAGC